MTLALVPVLAIATLVLACGGSDNKSSAAAPTKASGGAAISPTSSSGSGAANNITITDFKYTPARFNAAAGQSVSITVSNQGAVAHTFTITGVVDSGQIAPGQTKTVTFTPQQAGNLIYFCTVHGQAIMSGQIMVAGTSGVLPGAGDESGIVRTSAVLGGAG
jgi:plastocyanin